MGRPQQKVVYNSGCVTVGANEIKVTDPGGGVKEGTIIDKRTKNPVAETGAR